MTHPIPAPRPSSDSVDPSYRTPPRRGPLTGPHCTSCEHPTCRSRRAQHLPRLGGHLTEYRSEHVLAAAVQARNPHLIIWYGERVRHEAPRDRVEVEDLHLSAVAAAG